MLDTNVKAGLRNKASQLRREALEKGCRIEELERIVASLQSTIAPSSSSR